MKGTLCYGHAVGVPDDAMHLLDCADKLGRIVETACIVGGATVLQMARHEFQPQGATVIALLAESHAAVHTYPETRGYFVDVFTCGAEADAVAIARCICTALGGRAKLQMDQRHGDTDDR